MEGGSHRVDMKRNGDVTEDLEQCRERDNGIRNREGRTIWTVGGKQPIRNRIRRITQLVG